MVEYVLPWLLSPRLSSATPVSSTTLGTLAAPGLAPATSVPGRLGGLDGLYVPLLAVEQCTTLYLFLF